MAKTATTTVPAVTHGYQEIPIGWLSPSPHNPRRHESSEADAALVDSIRQVGILEPLVGRHLPDLPSGYVQVVAGHRRLRAAQQAGLLLVPVIVRDLSDSAALEIALIENNQRKDVHPLDEAEAFQRLMTAERYTPAGLGARLGRPARYVSDRVRLLNLVPAAVTAFEADHITLGHALALSRLDADTQAKALNECIEEEFDYDSDEEQARIVGPAPLQRLKGFIDRNVRLDLNADDLQEEFPELAAEVAQAAAEGATALLLNNAYLSRKVVPGEPLDHYHWDEATKNTPGARLGVVVQGRGRGKALWVTLTADQPAPSGARTPSRSSSPKPTAAEREQARADREAEEKKRVAEQARERRFEQVLIRAAVQLTDRTTAQLITAPMIRMVCEGLAGADCFDAPVLAAVTKELGLSSDAFGFGGAAARRKLPLGTLVRLMAVMAVGYESESGDAHEAFKAVGIDLKAIDKQIAKEEAEQTKAKPAAKPAKAAKKAKKR